MPMISRSVLCTEAIQHVGRIRLLTHLRLIAPCLSMLIAFAVASAVGPRDTQWKAVEDAMNKGLPKTAIEALQPIIDGALQDKAYAEAVKAISQRIALEGAIQGDKPEEKVTRMTAEIEKAPEPMRPVMQAILANWYWQYFQQNRWRFMQRTETATSPSDDFTTWALPQILAEIDKHFQLALANPEALQKTPIDQYDALLNKGNAPDAYRPTLYDFLVFDAIDFYAAGEQAGARSQDAFDLQADSPIFASAADFIAWEPPTDDAQSPTLRAITLYQDLLVFHQDDDDKSAFYDADLSRLVFGNNKAFGEEKSSRFKASLKRFIETTAGHEISARGNAQLAQTIRDEGDLVEAHKIASEGLENFPKSVGGALCFNLIQQIEARSAQVSTERVWNEPLPTIDVQYRNVTKIYFRLVPFDFEAFVQSERWNSEQLDQRQQQELLARTPVTAWNADLPATTDYQERVEELPTPDDLKPGAYYLIASHHPEFARADNQVSFTEIWVSDLALVLRNHNGDGFVDGFVLDARSGDPLANANVRAWQRTNNGNRRQPLPSTKTDENGRFEFRGQRLRGMVFHVVDGDNALSSIHNVDSYQNNRQPRPDEQTRFFTDRSIYRPGQTIQYKGICLRVDQQKDDYATIAGRELTVVFSDVNGKEIQRQKHRTNDYGSFSGSFNAPRDRLMGRMSIHVAGEPNGATQVTVEEYKRPKFLVSLDAPKEAARLGGEVNLQGSAKAYTGAAIDAAEVRWRVVREVRYPIWWSWRCWWIPQVPDAGQELAHGTTTTAADGSFDIRFDARPDPSVSPQSEASFQFTIYADVVDTTGETRSGSRQVNVGFVALRASVSSDDWLTTDTPTKIQLSTTTLDGEAIAADGVLKVYALQQPERPARGRLSNQPRPMYRRAGSPIDLADAPKPDPANPNSWALGEVAFEKAIQIDASGQAEAEVQLKAGIYRAVFETKDRFGKAVTALLPIQVLDPNAKQLSIKIPNLLASAAWSVQPGSEFEGVWGSGYDTARAFVEIEHRGELLQSFWTAPGVTQVQIKQSIEEAMRGGLTLRTTMVRENRAYLESWQIRVPWTNKQLAVRWEHFVSKLEPAEKQTWTAVIDAPDAKRAAAEMVAGMYDASLDAYLPHHWADGFHVFRHNRSNVYSQFENQQKQLQGLLFNWNVDARDASLIYRSFPGEIINAIYGMRGNVQFRSRRGGGIAGGLGMMEADSFAGAAPAPMAMAKGMAKDSNAQVASAPAAEGAPADDEPPAAEVDLENVSARKNLNETAFFFPHLIAGDDGTVRMEFTMPEALTKWRFMGFAHDNELRSGLLTDTVVTAKDLMVQPNPPRFVREGDVLEFTVKVSNQSPTRQTGTVRLSFAEARTGDSVDAAIGNDQRDQAFEIAAGQSKSLAWRIQIPDGIGFLTYKAVGSTGRLSDGEEGYLPVLSQRVLVTESQTLPIRGPQTVEFDFEKLLKSGDSDSLRHQSLDVQMVSNPSWYAVMALPYLMEYPHQCSEQTFSRLYANALARHIAGSDPKIHRVFEQWRGTPALESPLMKNQDLKAVMIEETPWLRQAESESEARRNVGILFDDNRLNDETARLLKKLADQQLDDGAWPWFPGGSANDYITLYITTGFGRMRHLGVDVDTSAAVKSLTRLDAWVTKQYTNIAESNRDENHLTATLALYLYGRSFFLEDQPVAAEHRTAVLYWLQQAKQYWLKLNNRQSQAHLAVALKRFGDLKTPVGIMASIKERSVSDEEMGMFWRDTEESWWWYRAPIETQAMMIEAFDEVMDDAAAVEDCKVWLLKQKQTQDWKTTKATTDAVYALLLRGTNLLASSELVRVDLGGQTVEPKDVEAGTGFYEQRFSGAEVTPQQGKITVTKVDEGVAWGSVTWQYMEEIAKITPHDGTPLTLTKQLFVKETTKDGPVLKPVDGPIAVGDELVVRIVLKTDRDMEYLHLKDQRGSGTEPVNVLSRYKYQDGLAYYESTRDTASHFFIDYLPKGTYVFEYSTRVQLRGRYQSGFANIQCMYAPEFNSHSESLLLEVQ